jgi:tetratricopeptide (TPR) repeat protein
MSGLRTTRRPTATGPGLAEWWALLHRGAALLTQQEYRQALAEFERVIALDPQSAYASIAHHLRGHAYLELQELQAARQDFQRALALWPAYILPGVLAEWLGMALGVDGKRAARIRPAERLEALAARAADDAQQRASVFLCLGIASWLRNARGRAQFYLEQALRVEPDWAACFWMGVVLASRNEGARARESLCQARMRSMPTALSLALNWLAPDQRAQLTS